MSKAVSISEGGKGRIFPQTDKLKINNVGGGNSLWLPEDEVVTGTLYADENGIYLAENDGFSCYDTVVVRVEDETDPDDPDWELDPDELDEDVWDEESLEEFQEDPEAFEEKFNDKEKWKAEKAKKEKSQKIQKVKSLKPSKITGIDPVDGNPYQVGVDPEGNLTKEMLPSSIHIVVAPWKRDYVNGEEINFYGMHVYLLDKDGHPFKTENYPTGEIPFEELLFPVTTADGSGQESKTWSDGQINALRITYAPYDQYDYNVPPNKTGSLIWHSNEQVGEINGMPLFFGGGQGDAELFVTLYHNYVYAIIISGENKNIDLYVSDVYGAPRYTAGTSGRTSDVFKSFWENGTGRYSFSLPESTISPGGKNADDLKPVGIEIPVQWLRSDGEMLEDNFTISISEENNTGTWGESVDPINNNESGHTSGGF